MDKKNIKDIYKLSPTQHGLLFNTLYALEAGVFLEQAVSTAQDLDVPNYVRAWQKVIERHSILRTAFFWEDLDEPLQVVGSQVELPVKQHDWRGLDPQEQQEQLATFLEADRRRGFDLSEAPLMRLALIRLDETTHRMVWSYHHILLDGWSVVLVLEEVSACYRSFREKRTVSLASSRPFRDYVSWLRQKDWAVAESFWRQKLSGFTTATALCVDRAPGSLPDPQATFDKQQIRLPAETTAAVRAFTRQYRITVNTLVQAAWACLLHRYSGERDVLFGVTVHGRPTDLSGFETMVGLFINAIPVRVQVPRDGAVLDWLQALQAEFAELLRYGYTPLVQIQSWNSVPRNKPMFDYIIVDQSYPGPTTNEPGLSYDLFEITGYPLTVYLNLGGALTLQISYDRQRFKKDTINRMLGHLNTLLVGMVSNPEQQLAQVPILTDIERHQLLKRWSAPLSDDVGDRCVHELFEAHAKQSPDAIAIVFQDQHLTYQELDRRANQLAHYLQTRGVGPDVCVGILLERSLEMVVSVLAVLKADGAYVPLDITHPPERLSLILKDTQATVLVTHSQLLKRLSHHEMGVICHDTAGAVIAQQCEEKPVNSVMIENLAYLVYTSGSTGKPKGVAVTHDNLVSIYRAWEAAYELGSNDCHLQMASFSFDVFSGDWVRALCSGAKLVLCPREFLLAPEELYDLMLREQINCGEFVPVVARGLMAKLQETQLSLDFMRLFIVGSDSWYVQEYRRLQHLCGTETRLINSYGLSETTIDSTYFEGMTSDLDANAMVPIGRPFANSEVYVLDTCLRLVPTGVPGELYIGGNGVVCGYLNRRDLTAERFVPHPFSPPSISPFGGDKGGKGARLYRTGDLVRYLPDGNLEFVGRVDHQVKVRGFRVELGEIEAVLAQHSAVREAVLLAREDHPGDRRLVAYVVPGEVQIQDLRTFLQERLPDYMAPAIFVPLETWPLTPSGKIDRRALPAPDGTRPEQFEEYVAPETPLEEKLAEIWAEVLDIDRVGIFDNFFDLGGDSLRGTQVISRINKQLRVNVPIYSLLEGPSIANLALLIEEILIERLEAVD